MSWDEPISHDNDVSASAMATEGSVILNRIELSTLSGSGAYVQTFPKSYKFVKKGLDEIGARLTSSAD